MSREGVFGVLICSMKMAFLGIVYNFLHLTKMVNSLGIVEQYVTLPLKKELRHRLYSI